MISPTMLLALPILLQVLGVNAAGFADILLRDIVLPRSPAGALVGHAFGIFDGTPTVEARALPSACSFVLGAIDYCSSVSPGWLTAPPKTQATCLCYSSASWAPSIFDNSVSSCAQYAKTADPADYSVISALGGFCSSAGNVRGNTVSTSARTTATSSFGTTSANPSVLSSSPTITPGPTTTKSTGSTALSAAPGCSTISRLLNSCSSATRGFTDLPAASQAACLCYTSSSYAPGNFDNNVQTCASFVSTASPTAYPVFSALQGFCDDEGDVRGSAVSVPAGRTSAALTGVGISALAGPTDAATTTAGPTANPTPNSGPVTVTGGSPATTSKSSAAGLELTAWNNMVLGIGSVAVSVILFL